jgi:hypothetical protein
MPDLQNSVCNQLHSVNHSSEAPSCVATQKIHNILWNTKVHYSIYKSPLLVAMLSHINLVHNTSSYPSEIRLRIIQPLKSYMHSSSPHSCYILYPSHCIFLVHCNFTLRSVRVIMLHITNFSLISCHYISFLSKYHSQHPVPRHIQSNVLPLMS